MKDYSAKLDAESDNSRVIGVRDLITHDRPTLLTEPRPREWTLTGSKALLQPQLLLIQVR